MTDTTIASRLAAILDRMATACRRSGRDPASVRLIAVSKTVPADVVQQAADAGQRLFGENRVQEARDKRPLVVSRHDTTPPAWHLIGPLQRNKVKEAVALFDMIHTVDSLALAEEIRKHVQGRSSPLPVLIQVNIGREEQKHGVLPEDAETLLRAVAGMGTLVVHGLMTIPPFEIDPEASRGYFRELRLMAERLRSLRLPNAPMEELSMGMSGDFGVAIEEGSTLVRVGTALFGGR